MKGDRIPDQDNIARFCRPMQVYEGQVQPTAFLVREGEPSLSVDWLEVLNCPSRADAIMRIREVYDSRLTVGAQARIAILNVGEVCEKVQTESPDERRLDILHDPIGDDISHSGIYNLRADDELIAELILETVIETHQARS
jgi:hypothetical protein